jgi:hypothetical protein
MIVAMVAPLSCATSRIPNETVGSGIELVQPEEAIQNRFCRPLG